MSMQRERNEHSNAELSLIEVHKPPYNDWLSEITMLSSVLVGVEQTMGSRARIRAMRIESQSPLWMQANVELEVESILECKEDNTH